MKQDHEMFDTAIERLLYNELQSVLSSPKSQQARINAGRVIKAIQDGKAHELIAWREGRAYRSEERKDSELEAQPGFPFCSTEEETAAWWRGYRSEVF
jgi:hypothetical protein